MPNQEKLKKLLKELEKLKATGGDTMAGLIYDLEQKLEGTKELEAKFDRTVEEIKASVPNLDTMFKSVKGNKGDSPTERELLDLIEPLIPEPIKGDTPTKKELIELIKPLIPPPLKGEPGKTITNQIIETIIEKTPIVTVKEVALSDTPEVIKQKLESLDDDDKLSIKAIKDLEDKLKELEKKVKVGGQIIYSGGGGVGKHNVVAHDLSDKLDGGITRVFSLPAFWKVISVSLSSFPNILRPTVDFTSDASASTLTITSEIPDASLSAGQTMIVLISEN